MGATFQLHGSLRFEDDDTVARAQQAFARKASDGAVQVSDLMWTGCEVKVALAGNATYTQVGTALDAVTALATTAASGHLLMHVVDQDSLLRIDAGSKPRAIIADVAPVAEGSVIERVRHPAAIRALAFSPDGKLLALAGEHTSPRGGDCDLTVWSLDDCQQVGRLRGLDNPAATVTFSHDSTRIAACGGSGGAKIWDVATGRLTGKVAISARTGRAQVRFRDDVASSDASALTAARAQGIAAWSNDGSLVAKVSGACVRISRLQGEPTDASEPLLQLYDYGATGSVRSLAWSPRGNELAIHGSDWLARWTPGSDRVAIAPQKVSASVMAWPVHDKGVVAVARGGRLERVALPDDHARLPEAPGPWPGIRQRLEQRPTPSELPNDGRREWRWNETAGGYDGVHTFERNIVWFHESNNPHASAGGTQSFEAFMRDGPGQGAIPADARDELFDHVRYLLAQRRKMN